MLHRAVKKTVLENFNFLYLKIYLLSLQPTEPHDRYRAPCIEATYFLPTNFRTNRRSLDFFLFFFFFAMFAYTIH